MDEVGFVSECHEGPERNEAPVRKGCCCDLDDDETEKVRTNERASERKTARDGGARACSSTNANLLLSRQNVLCNGALRDVLDRFGCLDEVMMMIRFLNGGARRLYHSVVRVWAAPSPRWTVW